MDINQKYMLNPDEVENVVLEDGNRIGFQFTLIIPYYRGVSLSMVNDLFVKVNGYEYPKEVLTLIVDGHSYTWPMIETVATMRWEYGVKATVFVPVENGLDTGFHRVEVGCSIRMSYGGRWLMQPTIAHMTVDGYNLGAVKV